MCISQITNLDQSPKAHNVHLLAVYSAPTPRYRRRHRHRSLSLSARYEEIVHSALSVRLLTYLHRYLTYLTYLLAHQLTCSATNSLVLLPFPASARLCA